MMKMETMVREDGGEPGEHHAMMGSKGRMFQERAQAGAKAAGSKSDCLQASPSFSGN